MPATSSSTAFDLLIGSLNDEALERRELARIDDRIRAEGMSAVITVKSYSSSEREQKRADLVQYLTDCVVLLEGNLINTSFSRTLRVTKYRGSGFIGNAVPMAIGPSGLEVIPGGATRGNYPVFTQRVSSGVARLDEILGGGLSAAAALLSPARLEPPRPAWLPAWWHQLVRPARKPSS